MLEDLKGLALLIGVVDVDYAGWGSHIGGFEAAEVFEALPSVDEAVGLLLGGVFASLSVVFGEDDMIP